MNYKIDKDTTVKEYVKNVLGISEKTLRSLKTKEDGIQKNGVRVTVRAPLSFGDVLTLKIEDNVTKTECFDVPLDILYEDEYIIAVNKPSDMPTHESHGHRGDTLANALCAYYAKKNRPFIFRSVNRLDRDTSGIVLVALDKITSAKLSEMIRKREINKEYIAFVSGMLPIGYGKTEGYIRRREESVIIRETCDKCVGADYALTEYEVIKSNEKASMVRVMPKTGRTHQIRVHFASIGHVLLGDEIYGGNFDLISRQALHAEKLEFIHPITKEKTVLFAPLPPDMQKLEDTLF